MVFGLDGLFRQNQPLVPPTSRVAPRGSRDDGAAKASDSATRPSHADNTQACRAALLGGPAEAVGAVNLHGAIPQLIECKAFADDAFGGGEGVSYCFKDRESPSVQRFELQQRLFGVFF